MSNAGNCNDAISLDDLDRKSFQASVTPFGGTGIVLDLVPGQAPQPFEQLKVLPLDGEWALMELHSGSPLDMDWQESIPADVPGSVHTALYQAGRIPDPTVGENQKIAREESYKTWVYRKTFTMPDNWRGRYRLEFAGICNRCTIWLNGVELGRHEGMFGGPDYAVEHLLQKENSLIVKLEPIPFTSAIQPYPENNTSWNQTVVINNVYGWHYSNMPSLGIWRSVRLVCVPMAEICHPFIATKRLGPEIMALRTELAGPQQPWQGTLSGEISPANFVGPTYHFRCPIRSDAGTAVFTGEFALPEARLWWPVDLGEPYLYRLQLDLRLDTDCTDGTECKAPAGVDITFGVRTIDMLPLPEGPKPDLYNWCFAINGHKTFVKGTGWCTADAMLDFSTQRLSRFLSLARDQHCQMIRAWGSGMPETDEFFQLCDEYGVMVLQEWPTAWNSHRTQPYAMLEDTVRRNTLRLRNHPSLVMWGAGNESSEPFGAAIDMMGRLAIELDDTRPYHRGEPWGGSTHDYTCYWGNAPLDYNLKLESRFFGEFGLACLPALESVQRYLSDSDRKIWPMADNASLRYHTPIFGHADDVNRLLQYARYFVPTEAPLRETIVGSQLSQAVGLRHTLERARTRWPDCSGALYYKMNDNFPAASWSCVDWYGVPKISHYFCQDAFAPLHACVILNTLNMRGTPQQLPVYLLDDAGALADHDWKVIARAFDKDLHEMTRSEYADRGSISAPAKLGSLILTADQTRSVPLLITAEVWLDDHLADRTFYFVNHEYDPGCLFRLPRAGFRWTVDQEHQQVVIENASNKPLVAVQIERPGFQHVFTVSDNYFWLDPGEIKSVQVNSLSGLAVEAWNGI